MASSTGKRTAVLLASWLPAGMVVLLLPGCQYGLDVRPAPPRTADGKTVESVAVDAENPAEVRAVAEHLGATARYRYALIALQTWYVKMGAYDKKVWTDRELENLDEARTFAFTGVDAPAGPEAISVVGVTEAELVEGVVGARKRWMESLRRLADVYAGASLDFKGALVRNVQERFDPIRVYDYFLEAEVPLETLRPTKVDAAADALFEKALKTHRAGKFLPLLAHYGKQRQALLLFRQLIEKHPDSTRIALSAYYVGEIYKEYFREYLRAVAWYRRAWQWDPNVSKPARFQAATVYDYHLAQRAKAVELYRAAIRHEQFNRSNAGFAARRVRELTRPRE